MKETFAGTLKKLRKEKNLSQQQLADMLFVERSSIANWETGRRLPDAVLLIRIAGCLNIDVNFLFDAIDNTVEAPNIIIVDDEKMRDLYGYLIQAMLFSDIGISTKMLLELTDVTRSTLAKRLKKIDDAGLLITEKRGTEKFYMTDPKKIEAISVGE